MGKHLDKFIIDRIAVPLFTNPNYSETSKLVYHFVVTSTTTPQNKIAIDKPDVDFKEFFLK